MTTIISAKDLLGDKSYAVQVRAVYENGDTTQWGPTFSIIRRTIVNGATMNTMSPSSTGGRISWSTLFPLDPEFEEEWLVKKFDTLPTEEQFDSSGTQVYRGSSTTNLDVDLSQESAAYFAVAKIDKYGNRSPISSSSTLFETPDAPNSVSLVNTTGGFFVRAYPPVYSEKNKFLIVRIKQGYEFSNYQATFMQKTGTLCTITIDGDVPLPGNSVQIVTNDSRFDGMYDLIPSAPGTISYNHSSSDSVSTTPTTGYVIPTAGGPSDDGLEVYRTEISQYASGEPIEVRYIPDISGQKIYVAVGIEDSFKNRANWTLTDGSLKPLIFGRNYIGERDPIGTVVGAGLNRTSDYNWKYGYIGFSDLHDSTTKLLTTTADYGRLRTQSLNETPDKIRLGIENGTTTTATFVKNSIGTVQSRIYPSSVASGVTVSSENLSLPIVDDLIPYRNDANSDISTIWANENQDGVAEVWAECSASDLLDDSINTNNPIVLDGIRSLTGSFSITPSAWGGPSDFPVARLALYAVGGGWNSERPETIYDAHYNPIHKYDYSRTSKGSYLISSASRSSNTVTMVLAAGRTSYPAVGESITVRTGNTNFDGRWIVKTSTSNTITFVTETSGTISSTAITGTLTVNESEGYVVVNKSKVIVSTWGEVTLTLDGALPGVGDLIDVRTGDIKIDGENFIVESVDVGSDSIVYRTVEADTVSSSATTGYATQVLVKDLPIIEELGSWTISKDTSDGLYNGTNPIEKTVYWNYMIPENENINNLRFAWVLEYKSSSFGLAWKQSTEYSIKIGRFEAWPGINAYASLSDENYYTEPQNFSAGATISGGLEIDGDASVTGSLTVGGGAKVSGEMEVDALRVLEGLNINGGATVDGAAVLNTSSMLVYLYDFPNTASARIGDKASNEMDTVNSIKAYDLLDESLRGGANKYIAIINWHGRFENGDGGKTYTFKMWRYDYQANFDVPAPTWNKIQEFSARGPRPGGAMSKVHITNFDRNPQPTYAITIQQSELGNGVDGVDNVNADSNELSLIVIPFDKAAQNATKASSPGAGGLVSGWATDTTGPTNYTSAALPTYEEEPVVNSGIITINLGWKESYWGDGSRNDSASGLYQGYWYKGANNEKSAWGLSSLFDWELSQALVSTIDPNAEVSIVSCELEVEFTKWYNNSGTGVFGTHNYTSLAGPLNWSNIDGKTSDRKRVDWNKPGLKKVDLGVTIGKELWKGHARDHLWSGNTNTQDFPNVGTSRGIIFGPGPSTASKFAGRINPGSLSLIMNIEWVNPPDTNEG